MNLDCVASSSFSFSSSASVWGFFLLLFLFLNPHVQILCLLYANKVIDADWYLHNSASDAQLSLFLVTHRAFANAPVCTRQKVLSH